MYSRADKRVEHANRTVQASGQARAVVDNRQRALVQRRLQAAADVSPQVMQLKKVITGEEPFSERGTLKTDFEERTQGNSAGMYGTIAFMPDAKNGLRANQIELVQIASMTSNNAGQQESYPSGSKDAEIPADQELPTSGEPQVKNMWRVDGKYHIDLLGSESMPRRSIRDDQISPAYNSERRDGKLWDGDKFDTVTMGSNGKVLDQYQVDESQRSGKKMPDTTTRKISQAPGYNKGNGEVRETELFDYPKGGKPCIATFHTTVYADGDPWATVRWGFSSVLNRDDSMEIQDVLAPEFKDGSSDWMRAALVNFNDIMANKQSWCSPEAVEEAEALLMSKESRQEGIENLQEIAKTLRWAIRRIDSEAEDKEVRRKFLTPHLETLETVVGLFHKYDLTKDPLMEDLLEIQRKVFA